MFEHFKQAVEAGENLIQASITERDTRYKFLAVTYLSHREGQQDRLELVYSRLNREPTKPEEKRPFLRLLHALLNHETIPPSQLRPLYTKLANALQRIDEEFQHTATVTIDGVIDFLKDTGGVSGLYNSRKSQRAMVSHRRGGKRQMAKASHTSRTIEKAQDGPEARPGTESGTVLGGGEGGNPRALESRVAAGANQAPGQGAPQCQDPQHARIEIEIANLKAWAIKDGEDTMLKIPAFTPGEHFVRLKVGEDGIVEAIISEEQSYREAA